MDFGKLISRAAVLAVCGGLTHSALAQSAAPATQQTPPPVVVTPEVSPDRQITFRLLGPQAESVRLTDSDIPGSNYSRLKQPKNTSRHSQPTPHSESQRTLTAVIKQRRLPAWLKHSFPYLIRAGFDYSSTG